MSNYQEIIYSILLKWSKRKGGENRNVNLCLAQQALGRSWLHYGHSDQGPPSGGWSGSLKEEVGGGKKTFWKLNL